MRSFPPPPMMQSYWPVEVIVSTPGIPRIIVYEALFENVPDPVASDVMPSEAQPAGTPCETAPARSHAPGLAHGHRRAHGEAHGQCGGHCKDEHGSPATGQHGPPRPTGGRRTARDFPAMFSRIGVHRRRVRLCAVDARRRDVGRRAGAAAIDRRGEIAHGIVVDGERTIAVEHLVENGSLEEASSPARLAKSGTAIVARPSDEPNAATGTMSTSSHWRCAPPSSAVATVGEGGHGESREREPGPREHSRERAARRQGFGTSQSRARWRRRAGYRRTAPGSTPPRAQSRPTSGCTSRLPATAQRARRSGSQCVKRRTEAPARTSRRSVGLRRCP